MATRTTYTEMFHTGFYATKDGEDAALKILGVTRNSVIAGTGVGLFTMRWFASRNWKSMLTYFNRGFIPVVALGATFAGAVQIAGNVRGEDGPWNHFLGGMATVPILAAVFRRAPEASIFVSFFIGVGSAYHKGMWDMYGDPRPVQTLQLNQRNRAPEMKLYPDLK